jgi:NAD(P)-dependent dehydrogenase (short-subunit alcohol dehydrogenase family)
MDKPVILVTGASRGLGAAIAHKLSLHNVQLILNGKSRAALEEVDDRMRAEGRSAPTLIPLDLRKLDDIDKLAGGIAQRFGRLDALIACHVDMPDLSPVAHLEPKIFENMVKANLLAQHRLVRAMDPLLGRAPSASAIFFTCDAGRSAKKAFWGGLAACKAGLEALVEAYRAECGKTAITVELIDPGPLPTRSRKRAFPSTDLGNSEPVEAAAGKVVAGLLARHQDWGS